MYEKSNTYLENLEAFQTKLTINCKQSFPTLHSKNKAHLEKSILKASDQYVSKDNKSTWGEEWFDDAYLAYFLFTQSARLFYVFWRIQNVLDFKTINKIIDFGSGPSTARLAFDRFWGDSHNIKWTNIDSSKIALEYGRRLEKNWNLESQFITAQKIPEPMSDGELLILSFSNCEGLDLEQALKYKNILILEPGQLSFSKKLIEFRSQALDCNFNVLAPCPHQDLCPMADGDKNWCHDTAPKPSHINGFDLPFSKNRLNFSYLLLSQTTKNQSKGATRVVGDLRQEKGKTKVAICRDKNPEFLSWLKKSKLELQLNRGDLIELPNTLINKGQEVRIEEPTKTLH
jgi:hypothetical protein